LHLLHIRPRIGQTRSRRVDIGLHRADITAQTALFTFEQIHLLRVYATCNSQPESY
jgi:hypothetical protein